MTDARYMTSAAQSTSVRAGSDRVAEVLRWLCPQLCRRLLSSWQARRPAITKYLQVQLRKYVATVFKDMQALMTIMKQVRPYVCCMRACGLCALTFIALAASDRQLAVSPKLLGVALSAAGMA